VSVVTLEDLPFIPISISTKGGKRLSRQVPPPEEVRREGANETGLIVLVAEGGAILAPSVLIRLAYDLLVTINVNGAYLPWSITVTKAQPEPFTPSRGRSTEKRSGSSIGSRLLERRSIELPNRKSTFVLKACSTAFSPPTLRL
jgi:hypothetical protein